MKKPYKGHESFAAWNTALWLSNITTYYRRIQGLIKDSITRQGAIDKACAVFEGEKAGNGMRMSRRSITLYVINEWNKANDQQAEGE